MKYCDSCGNEIKKDELYCSKCGTKITKETKKTALKESKKKVESKEVLPSEDTRNNVSKEDHAGSLTLGIISIILAFTFIGAPIALVLSIIGLILVAKTKTKSGMRTGSLVVNIIGIVLGFFITCLLIFGLVLAFKLPDYNYNYDNIEEKVDSYLEDTIEKPSLDSIKGTWNCTEVSKALNPGYSAILKLEEDSTFIFGKANDLENNYVKGAYKVEDHTRTINRGYDIDLDGYEVVENGVKSTTKDLDYEMVITKYNSTNRAILTNDETEQLYYCYK